MKNRAELIIENGQLINKLEKAELKNVQLECQIKNNWIGAMRDIHKLIKTNEARVN